jgi:ABC-type methionine transport system ATPase subunit
VTYSIEAVTKVYLQGRTGVCALNGINLQVAPGEHIALIGQSGAGKSTLFRLLNATSRPTSGAVLFEGRNVAGLSAQRSAACDAASAPSFSNTISCRP